MSGIWAFVRARWYWIVGALLGFWALSKLLRHGTGSTTSQATTPAGVAVQYTGTSANDAAIQVAQLNSQSQLAAAQIAAAQQSQLATIAEKATESTNTAKVSIAGLEADVARLASNNATALGIVQSNNGATVAVTQANDAYLLGVNTNASNLSAIENTNATQLSAYGIQAKVASEQIAALRDVANTVSNNQSDILRLQLSDAMQVKTTELNQTYALVSSGQLNKGGAGGTNQLAAWNAAINPASAGTGDAASAAVASAQASSDQIAKIISSIGGAVTSGIKAIAA